jgi:uncharacterized membrane protein
VNPNYHVILIHYPLGVFVLGVILELFSFLWRRSSVRVAARWMILLGALLSLPAATSGIAALIDVKSQGTYSMDRYSFMRMHVILMSIGTALAVAFAVAALGASDRLRDGWLFRTIVLLGLICAWGVMTWGSWYGGETIYQQGTAVALVKYRGKDAKTILRPPAIPTISQAPMSADEKYQRYARFFVGGEKQVHIVFSGLALAIAFGALGLSIRRLTTLREMEADEIMLEQHEVSVVGGPPARVTDDVTVMRTLNPDAQVEAMERRVPVSRFWVLAVVATVITASLGYWILEKDRFATAEGWHAFTHHVISYSAAVAGASADPSETNRRHFAHFVLTIGLVAVMIIMALLAIWAPRRPLVLTFFAALLVLMIAAQIWVGVLLSFDEEGPLLHWNKPDTTGDETSMVYTPAHLTLPASR